MGIDDGLLMRDDWLFPWTGNSPRGAAYTILLAESKSAMISR